eukprot:CAMPEP_0194280752 /NCGR_PEP_ID=MMETSP0169-20130528/18611_1 /TAXON_ID=218684 /ORGANISM="Corethron pennatum, Strain L29A3" /LENGTH=454 /DNA_ID=CAMNT_0039025601 /DNA_START=82 /DNA_END=1444 /DNA_ORIENTATION=+
MKFLPLRSPLLDPPAADTPALNQPVRHPDDEGNPLARSLVAPSYDAVTSAPSRADEVNPVTRYTYILTACAALNSCNLGYDIGVNTDAGVLLQRSMSLTDLQVELFMGSVNFYAMVGALGSGYVSDKYGRRNTFRFAAIGFVVGTLIMAGAPNYYVLMIGRIFVGIGIGVGLAIDPIYISEISPASHRGSLVTWSEISTNIGGCFIFLVYHTFNNKIALFTIIFTKIYVRHSPRVYCELRVLSGSGGDGVETNVRLGRNSAPRDDLPFDYVMPESPRWLVKHGYLQEAAVVVRRLNVEGFDVGGAVKEIEVSIVQEERALNKLGWGALLAPTPAIRAMLIVGVGTAVSQQIVGIDAIQYYLVFILENAGIVARAPQAACLVILGFLKLFWIVVAGRLFDSKGRRPLMFISLGGMVVALIMLAVADFSQLGGFWSVLGLAIYLSAFSLGMGPGAW